MMQRSSLCFIALLIFITFFSCTDIPLSENSTILNSAVLGFWQGTDDKVIQIFSGADGKAILRRFTYNTSTEKFDMLDDLSAFFTDLTIGGRKHQFISVKHKVLKAKEAYQSYEYSFNGEDVVLSEINTSLPFRDKVSEKDNDYFKTTANFQDYVVTMYNKTNFFVARANYEKRSNNSLRKPKQPIAANDDQEKNYYGNELNRFMKSHKFYGGVEYVQGSINSVEIEKNATGSVTLARTKMLYKDGFRGNQQGTVEVMYDNGFAYLLRPSFDYYMWTPENIDYTQEQLKRIEALVQEYQLKNKSKYDQKTKEELAYVVASMKQKYPTRYKGKGLASATYINSFTTSEKVNTIGQVGDANNQVTIGETTTTRERVERTEEAGLENITDKEIVVLGIRRYKNIYGWITTEDFSIEIQPGDVVRKITIHPYFEPDKVKLGGDTYYFINFK